jgi:uncharacterized protein YuzE
MSKITLRYDKTNDVLYVENEKNFHSVYAWEYLEPRVAIEYGEDKKVLRIERLSSEELFFQLTDLSMEPNAIERISKLIKKYIVAFDATEQLTKLYAEFWAIHVPPPLPQLIQPIPVFTPQWVGTVVTTVGGPYTVGGGSLHPLGGGLLEGGQAGAGGAGYGYTQQLVSTTNNG